MPRYRSAKQGITDISRRIADLTDTIREIQPSQHPDDFQNGWDMAWLTAKERICQVLRDTDLKDSEVRIRLYSALQKANLL